MNSDIDTLNLVNKLADAGAKPIITGLSTHVMVPEGYDLKNIDEAIERAQMCPNRKKGTKLLLSIDSMVVYAEQQQAQGNGYILCDPDGPSITAVFNDDLSMPGWRDHKAVFKPEKTPEFARWMGKNGQQMSQSEFAEFIEDNLADVPGQEGVDLLNMATTIAASTAINFSSAKRLQDGQTQLVYNEVIDAKAGADGSLKIPQKFSIGVRIFKNGEGYKLSARLKYRLHSGNVKFWYELERPERAVEDAFAAYIEVLRDKTSYTVLLGRA